MARNHILWKEPATKIRHQPVAHKDAIPANKRTTFLNPLKLKDSFLT